MSRSLNLSDPAANLNFGRDWGDGPTQITFRSEGLDPAKPTGKPKNTKNTKNAKVPSGA